MQSEGEKHISNYEADPGIEVLINAAPFYQRFQEFRRKELFTDLYIQCGSECYFVHSSVLAAACPPVCLLLEASQRLSKQDTYCSRDTKNPPHDVIDEELKINSKYSEAHTWYGKVKILSYNGGHGIQNTEHFILTIPFKDTMDSDIILSLSNHATGVWNLLVQGIEPQVINYIIHFVYREKFIAAKECIHNFVSTAKSLELLGYESLCEELQFATPGERIYFGAHDENKTINSSSRKVEASYVDCASMKSGPSFQSSACNLSNNFRGMKKVKSCNCVQKLRNEIKAKRSSFRKCEAAQGLNENASKQEGNFIYVRKYKAAKVKRLRKKITGKSKAQWRSRERGIKARHDCFPRQEFEIKTRYFIASKQEDMETMNGSSIRQEGATEARNCFIPKQSNTKVSLYELEENSFLRMEKVSAMNSSVSKYQMTKNVLQPLNPGVLDMNIPKTFKDVFDEQKYMTCPGEIYSCSSSHIIQNRDCAVKVGSTTGNLMMCNRGNSFIYDNTLQEGTLHDVTFSVPQLYNNRKNTSLKLNAVLVKDKFNMSIAEAQFRSFDKVEPITCASQKILEETGLHETEECNDTERTDNNILKFNGTLLNADKGVNYKIKKLYNVMEDQAFIRSLKFSMKRAKASDKKLVSKHFPNFKTNRKVRNLRVYHEHCYPKLQTDIAVKTSQGRVLNSLSCLRISCKGTGMGIHRVDFSNDARNLDVRFYSPKNKIHFTYDTQDQILEHEGNLEANKRGPLGTQSHMLTNESVQKTYEIVQSRSKIQGKEKLIVVEENSKRVIIYQKRQNPPYFNIISSGEDISEPVKYSESHKKVTYHPMNCEQNTLFNNQGPSFVDYRHVFEFQNKQGQCNMCDWKLEDQTNYMAKHVKQTKFHPFSKTEMNNHLEYQGKDYKLKYWKIMTVEDDRCKFDGKDDRHRPSAERESSFESGNGILKGISKKTLKPEFNVHHLDYVEEGAVTKLGLEQWQDNTGKISHGDVLSYRLGDRKRAVQMIILEDKYEDGKSSVLMQNCDRKCPVFENSDVEETLIEAFFTKAPLLDYSGLKKFSYYDDSKYLPVKKCTTEDLFVKNNLKGLPVVNVTKDIEHRNNYMKKRGFKKRVECELCCNIRDINTQVEVAHNDHEEDSQIDMCSKMKNLNFSEKMQIVVDINDQNEGMEDEKKKVCKRNASEVNKSGLGKNGKAEQQAERNYYVDDQDVMNGKMNALGVDREDEIKIEVVEVEDFCYNEFDSKVRRKNFNFEGISERKKLGFQEAIFSINKFDKCELLDLERSDQGKMMKLGFMTSELERIEECDSETIEKEKLDKTYEYTIDFSLSNMLEENCHNSSHMAIFNQQIEAEDLTNKYYGVSLHKFSVSLDFKNSFDCKKSKIIDQEKYVLQKIFDFAQERGRTSLEYEGNYSPFMKEKSLQKNVHLRKYDSQDLVCNSRNNCKNSEIQGYEQQYQIQMLVDTAVGMKNIKGIRINYELAKESSILFLRESKIIKELQPLPSWMAKKYSKMFCRRNRRKLKVQVRKQRFLKNPLYIKQNSDSVYDKTVEVYQQNKHSTQFTLPPNTNSCMCCTKCSGKCIQISSSSPCSKNNIREAFKEDLSRDDELLSHVTWGKFEEEVEYIVVGDAVSSDYIRVTHSHMKTNKRYVTEAAIEPVVRSKEFLVPPGNPGSSIIDFTEQHSSAQLDNREHIHLTSPGKRKRESLDFYLEKKGWENQSKRLEAHAGRLGDKFQEINNADSRNLHYSKENNLEKSPESKLPFKTSRIQLSDKFVSDFPEMCISNIRDRKGLERRNILQSQEKNTIDKSWSVITNYDNSDTVSSQNSARAEFIVEVGEVSVKIREYSNADYQKSRLAQETPVPVSVIPPNTINNNLQMKEKEQICDMVEKQPFTEEGAFQCLGCPDMFVTLEALTSHFRETHMKKKFFMICPVENCSARISYNKMEIHIKNHIVLQNFKCPNCSFSTSRPSALGRHQIVHKQKGSFLNKCQEHHSGTPNHLRRESSEEHLDSSNLETRLSVSQKCRKNVSNTEMNSAETTSNDIDRSLIKKGILLLSNTSPSHHKQYQNKVSKRKIKMGRLVSRRIHHRGGNKYSIHCCSLVFSTVKAFRKHFRHCHLQGQEFVPCPDPDCPVKLWGSNIDSHLHCHSMQAGYKCHQCTYSGKNARALRIHTRAHKKKSEAVQEEDRSIEQRQTETTTNTELGKRSSVPQLDDIHIEKTRKLVTHPINSTKKRAFPSSTQREEKEMVSCLGYNAERKKNLTFQRWKSSQANMLLNYDSKNKDIYEFEEKHDVSTKNFSKKRMKKLCGKSKVVKKCLLKKNTLVKKPYRSTKNIKKLDSLKPTKIKRNYIQKVDKASSLVAVVGTAQNTQKLSSESYDEHLKSLTEEGGYNTYKSQSDMKLPMNSTQSSNYDCPLCMDCYDTADRLVSHYICSHPYHSPYTCKFKGCPVLLKKRDSWKHIVGHLYRRSYMCRHCSYSHQNLHLLKHHLSCHSEVIQEMQLKDEVHLQIQGPSGYTEVVLNAESFKKRLKRKLGITTDMTTDVPTKHKKKDIYSNTESTPKLARQSMLNLAFETCIPQDNACF